MKNRTVIKSLIGLGMMSSFLFTASGTFATNSGAAKDNTEAKIEELLAKMTLEEKIGQLNQLSGRGLSGDMLSMVKAGQVGSILNEVDPETVNALQREAVENSRLGIPLIFARDVIHGFKTIFPIPLGQAATWNPELVKKGAAVAADEASSVGIRWTFSPMVDISRDARWGRIAESFGEDPYLTEVLGIAMVDGYQSDDLSNPNTMAACVKHFAGYGASESGKDYNTANIPETLLRDVYLRPFKACADAGAATFMCSFNDLNGVPSSGNKYLLRDILRDEWGYDGVMCSDWGSIQQMIPHGYSEDLKQAALQAADAGVDVDMESYAYISNLKNLVEEGSVSEKTIDDLVRNVLRLKYRLGLFDNPYVDVAKSRRFFTADNMEAALHAAEESAVLLKNANNILPLGKKIKKIAVVGPMANTQHDQNGTWCFDLEKEKSITPLTSLQKKYGKSNVAYAPGLAHTRDKSHDGFAAARAAAEKSDVVLYFAGEEAVLSGEAHCRADIDLPGAQTELLKELKATGKPVVLVIMTGRPNTIANDAELADAVVYAFHGGTMAGPALTNVLTGAVNPSGKLPVCLPRMVGQMPLYYARKNTGRPAENMILMDELPLEAGQTSTGCTSFYLDAGDGPLYPFGYGLSYTTFKYGDVKLSSESMGADGTITATCEITNTGSKPGAEVAQLYIRDLVASAVRPVKELRGFQKLTLKPGETRTVEFTIKPEDLGFHSQNGKFIIEPGNFNLWIAPDSSTGEPVKFSYK